MSNCTSSLLNSRDSWGGGEHVSTTLPWITGGKPPCHFGYTPYSPTTVNSQLYNFQTNFKL